MRAGGALPAVTTRPHYTHTRSPVPWRSLGPCWPRAAPTMVAEFASRRDVQPSPSSVWCSQPRTLAPTSPHAGSPLPRLQLTPGFPISPPKTVGRGLTAADRPPGPSSTVPTVSSMVAGVTPHAPCALHFICAAPRRKGTPLGGASERTHAGCAGGVGRRSSGVARGHRVMGDGRPPAPPFLL